MSTFGAPAPRDDHVEVWTGSRLVIWGGYGGGATVVNSGGSYDPASDTWTTKAPMPTALRPSLACPLIHWESKFDCER